MRTKTIAEIFVNQIISRYGVPLEVNTDQGKNFDSRLMKELSELIGIKKTRITPLHPQSNGQVERQHQTLLNYLTKYIHNNQRDWDRWVSLFLLAYSPAEMYTGFDLRLPLDLVRGCLPGEVIVEEDGGYAQQLRRKLNEIHELAREKIDLNSEKMKFWYDKQARHVEYSQGQKVWFFNPRRVKRKSSKLQSNWMGPWEVVKKINDVVYCIRRSPRHKSKIVNIDRLRSYTERETHL